MYRLAPIDANRANMAKVSGHHGLSLSAKRTSSRKNPTEGSFAAAAKSAQKSGTGFLLAGAEKLASLTAVAVCQGGCVRDGEELEARFVAGAPSKNGEAISLWDTDPARGGCQAEGGGMKGA
jgi:hypothetical protein